jgi:hypothetical protein
MATLSNNDLGQNLDQLVAGFVQAAQQMVLAAVAEGLAAKPTAAAKAASSTKSAKPIERAKAKNSKSRKSSKPAEGTKPSTRRTPAKVAELGERFYGVLCRHPGATMAILAPKVGASPRELHRSVALLKRAGRVRSVGQRQWTTYFPMTSIAAVA